MMVAAISGEAIKNALGLSAVCALLVIAIVFLVCGLIDYTRRHEEDPIGSLVEEEREIEKGKEDENGDRY